MTIGITENGFVIETLDEIRAGIASELGARAGTEINQSDLSAIWHFITIVAERIRSVQELAQAVYSSFDPDTATGDGLVAVRKLTGTLPLPAKESVVTLTLTGNAGVTVPALSKVSDGDLVEFETDEDATLVAIGNRATSTAYLVGVRRVSSGNVYVVTVAGTTSGGAGPSTDDDAIVDGSVTWRYVGEGVACVDVSATCVVKGPTQALSGALVEIETPVVGWSGVRNLLDADLGYYKETDESYRLRGQAELAGAGNHTAAAIFADLSRLTGVANVTILQNQNDYTFDTMPAHTVEALVRGGDDEDIAQMLLDYCISVGIKTFGNTTVIVTDIVGETYAIKFSRPEEVPIYATLNVKVDATLFPDDGADQIALAIITWGDAQKSGKDAVAAALIAQAFKVEGVLDVSSALISTSPTPTLPTTIAISKRQLATYDTSRIIVNVTNATP